MDKERADAPDTLDKSTKQNHITGGGGRGLRKDRAVYKIIQQDINFFF